MYKGSVAEGLNGFNQYDLLCHMDDNLASGAKCIKEAISGKREPCPNGNNMDLRSFDYITCHACIEEFLKSRKD